MSRSPESFTESSTESPTGPSAGSRHPWWVLAAVSLATFTTTLDNNIVNVALPTIQRDLGLSVAGLEWMVSGYILAFAGLLLTGGRLADVYGRRRIFLAGIAVFTLASLLAGVAGDQTILLTGRVVQGVGAALLAPSALTILAAAFTDARERGLAIGVWSAVGAVSLALGPLAGGLISQWWSWGWIFGVNVPIGVVTFVLAAVVVHDGRAGRTPRSLDVPGLVASTVALLAATYVLIEGGRHGWTSAPVVAAAAVAVVGTVAFVVVERRAADPMLDLDLFARRVFTGGTLVIGLWAFGVFGIYFFTALYLQHGLRLPPSAAGLAFVPMAVAMTAVAALSGPIAHRFGTRPTVTAGLVLMVVAILGVAAIDATSVVSLLPWFVAYGVGAGLLVPLTAAVVGELPPDRGTVASGVLNVAREAFGLLGITVLGAVLTNVQAARELAGAQPMAAFVSGYRVALLVAATIIAIGVPITWRTLRSRRSEPATTTTTTAQAELAAA